MEYAAGMDILLSPAQSHVRLGRFTPIGSHGNFIMATSLMGFVCCIAATTDAASSHLTFSSEPPQTTTSIVAVSAATGIGHCMVPNGRQPNLPRTLSLKSESATNQVVAHKLTLRENMAFPNR